MFAVLEINNKRKLNYFGNIKAKILKNSVQWQIDQYRTLRFIRIFAYENKKGLRWEKIAEVAKNATDGVLLPIGIEIPKDIKIKKVSVETYQRSLFISSIQAIIKQSGLNTQDIKVCIIDSNGRLGDFILDLVEVSGMVKVITDNLDNTENVAKYVLEEKGVNIIVTDEATAVKDCNIIVADGEIDETYEFNGDQMIFSLGSKSDKFHMYTKCKIRICEKLKKICPEDIDETDFAVAVYLTTSQYERIDRMPVLSFSADKEYIIEDLAKMLYKSLKSDEKIPKV